MVINLLKLKAVEKGWRNPDEEIDSKRAFLLVRDMPYMLASSRDPETTIREWHGTYSGKHYLLKQVFSELGNSSRLITRTTVAQIDPQGVEGKLRTLLEQSNGRFVDVHNYLILELPEGQMIADATWPNSTDGKGTVVNNSFVLRVNHKIAYEPVQIWEVAEDQDPQAFKEQILRESLSDQELANREEFIKIIGEISNSN